VFYSRAAQPRAGGAPVFHDTTGGSNSVPGQTGFAAVVGYDQVNGLGSINASLLASQSDAQRSLGYFPAGHVVRARFWQRPPQNHRPQWRQNWNLVLPLFQLPVGSSEQRIPLSATYESVRVIHR
jgi:hypothetical protein